MESKIPSISGLATTSALTAVENKIPDVISSVKKTNYNTKISKIEKKLTDHNHDKHITTPEFNKFTKEVFNERLNQVNLVTKTYFDTKLINLNKKINANKTKHLLVENEIKNPKNIWSRYFRGKSHFEEDGTQNYLVFQPVKRYFKKITGVGNGSYNSFWKSKGLPDENINSVAASNHSITQNLSYY